MDIHNKDFFNIWVDQTGKTWIILQCKAPDCDGRIGGDIIDIPYDEEIED